MPHRVLLTGANGYVGSHILSQLLAANHSVRAVVRSQSKADAVAALHPGSSSNLDFAIVPDITAPGAYDEALKSEPNFDVVIHTASPFLYKVINDVNEFLKPAVGGTTEILKGIKKSAPSVKRVLVTSSFAAIGAFGRVDDRGKVYTAADWNPVTIEEVEKSKALGPAYLASKKFAEKAAWEFVETEKPGFDLVTINPPMIYGPLAHKVHSTSELNESTARIWNLFLNPKNVTPESELPPDGLPLYADVRDVAKAHVLAIDAAEAGNKRILLCAGPITSQQISDILRADVPGAAERTPKGTPGKKTRAPDAFTADASVAEKVLGLKWRSAKDTFAELGKQLLEIDNAERL